MSEKTYKVMMSERCFRFKPDAIPGHAPAAPGVYEFVTFDDRKQPKVLFVGVANDATVQQSLMEHLLGARTPTAQELFSAHENVYFDYVARSDGQSSEDRGDIAAALIEKHKPPFNSGASPSSGRWAKVTVQEVEIL